MKTILFILTLFVLSWLCVTIQAQQPTVIIDGPLASDEYFFSLVSVDQGNPSMRVKVIDGDVTIYNGNCVFWVYKPVGMNNEAWIERCGPHPSNIEDVAVVYDRQRYVSISHHNPIDFHDFHIDKVGNIYTLIYNNTTLGGPFGFTIQKQSREHKLLWQWNSDDYLDPSHATLPIHQAGDYAHANSIDVAWPYVLISARHTNSIIKIDERTGDIVWVLGGNGNTLLINKSDDFTPPCFPQFARFVSQTTVSVFDTGLHCDRNTRGVVYKIDRGHVTEIEEITPRNIQTIGSGSYLKQSTGHLISWGFAKSKGDVFATEVNNWGTTEFKVYMDNADRYKIFQIYSRRPYRVILPFVVN